MEEEQENVEEEEEEEQPTAMPVPRVKVGPDGQLIVDEKSLIIERTEQKNRSIIGLFAYAAKQKHFIAFEASFEY